MKIQENMFDRFSVEYSQVSTLLSEFGYEQQTIERAFLGMIAASIMHYSLMMRHFIPENAPPDTPKTWVNMVSTSHDAEPVK